MTEIAERYECETCGDCFETPAALGGHQHHHETEYEREYSNSELIEYLQQHAREHGNTPTRRMIENTGGPSPMVYRDRFGTWTKALNAAGLEPKQRFRVSDTEFLDAIRDVAKVVGRPPTREEMDTHGRHDSSLYRPRFDSWNDALTAAGFDTREQHPVGEEHPQWRGGRFNYGRGWSESKRQSVRSRDDWECQSCGISNEEHVDDRGNALHVHHIVPRRQFTDAERANRADNLVTLCHSCHAMWEEMAPLRPQME